MKKQDIIKKMSTELYISNDEAKKAFEMVFEGIVHCLKTDNVIAIPQFGTFKTSARAARKGRNPLTGAELNISARTAITFKPSSVLKEKFN